MDSQKACIGLCELLFFKKLVLNMIEKLQLFNSISFEVTEVEMIQFSCLLRINGICKV